MAQVYKMMLGTSGKIWEQLTVKDDGRMTLYFHGTDRSVTQQVTLIENGEWKGWLRSEKGSMWPGIESGKWQLTAEGGRLTEDVRCKMADEPLTINPEPLTVNPEPLTVNQPKRQRKPRKPRVERQEPITVNPEPLTVNHQSSSTMKAIGMVAAATVALFVIYETGLLIPLGLIGLATGGILK